MRKKGSNFRSLCCGNTFNMQIKKYKWENFQTVVLKIWCLWLKKIEKNNNWENNNKVLIANYLYDS
jgi:hypothetical protein